MKYEHKIVKDFLAGDSPVCIAERYSVTPEQILQRLREEIELIKRCSLCAELLVPHEKKRSLDVMHSDLIRECRAMTHRKPTANRRGVPRGSEPPAAAIAQEAL